MAAVAVGMCTLVAPLLHAGFPAGHDLSAHVTYTYLFDLALGQGQFPVRWTEGVGQSQPLFNFYQPGFYYLVELVHLAVRSLSLSMKLTSIGLWWFGAALMFLLCARHGRAPAACAALVFAFAPYVLLDVYVRAAYPELAAIAVAPGVLWAIDRLCRAPGARALALMAGLLAVMLVCHLPSVLIFLPVFALHAGRLSLRAPRRLHTLAWLAAAVVLGVGLAAFYWLPALGERHLIRMSALTRDYFDYRRHFVEPSQWWRYDWGFGGSVEGTADGLSFQIGVVQWVLVGAAGACSVFALARGRFSANDWDLVAWMGALLFALFMMTGASSAVWSAVPALSYIQFPWRYSMIVAVACGPIAANLISRVGGSMARAVLVGATTGALLILSVDQRRPDHYVPLAAMDIDKPYWRLLPEAQKVAFVEVGYFPVTARGAAERRDRAGTARWTIASGSAAVTQRTAHDHLVDLDVQAQGDTDLIITSHMFPRWTVWVDGRETLARPDPDHGFIQVQVPPGRHHVKAELVDTGLRRFANGLSVASALVVFALVAASLTRRRRAGLSPADR